MRRLVPGVLLGLLAGIIVTFVLPMSFTRWRVDGPNPFNESNHAVGAIVIAVGCYKNAKGVFPCESEGGVLHINMMPKMLREIRNTPEALEWLSEFSELQFACWDAERGVYRPTTFEEFQRGGCGSAYILDGWGNPIIYRLVRNAAPGKEYRPVVYSTGADGMDGVAYGWPGDDLGLWEGW